MKKKFQIFISSTYEDLKKERSAVAQNVLESNLIPVGMEYFGASDQKQLDFIKAEIDQSDFYILIIGGKYGSIDPSSGKSFTQLEYEYAASSGIPVLLFLRADRHELPPEQRETDGLAIQKLDAFIADASGTKRIRAEWTDRKDLVLQSANALNKEINRTASNSVGWVRADTISSANDALEIEQLKKKIAKLEASEYSADATDAQSLYEVIGRIVTAFRDERGSNSELSEMRRLALGHLRSLVTLGLNGEATPNVLFNAQVHASRLDMEILALQLATICNYFQSSNSHTLAVLHRQCSSASAFEVVEDGSRLKLAKLNLSPKEILENSLNQGLLLASDAPAPQCEIVYSQFWNIAQNLRESNCVEKFLCVLLYSKAARQQSEIPYWIDGSLLDGSLVQKSTWENQNGKTVPSYLIGKIADCIAFSSPRNWRELFLESVQEAIQVHSEESPMATWSQHFRRDLLQTTFRVDLQKEVDGIIKNVMGITRQEFESGAR